MQKVAAVAVAEFGFAVAESAVEGVVCWLAAGAED
jgi:hypothetical protein